MTRDVVGELSQMISDEKRKAFDNGCLAITDQIINLAEMSGGKLYVSQLKEFKTYLERLTNDRRQTGEHQGEEDAKEDPSALQSDGGSSATKWIHTTARGHVHLVEGEGSTKGQGQASESISEAESQ